MQSNKAAIIQEVTSIILKYAKPIRIYLYGSEASGESKLTSDIDIAFDDEKFTDIHLIKEEIQNINTLLKVDVVNISKTEKRFKERVETTGKVIYSSTKKLRAEDGLYNFNNALVKFNNVLEMENEIKLQGFEDMYLDLIVKRFEFTFEMAWKALKRLLEFHGFEVKSPRMVFQEGYAQGLIKNEAVWLDMIEQRNLTSHVYDEYQFKEILNKTQEYNKAFKELKTAIESSLK